MKKFVLILLSLCLLSSVSAAEIELSGLSLDELHTLRQEINEEIARRTEPETTDGEPLSDLFPDPVFARYIRDELGMFSIKDIVSQDQLDTITDVHFLSMDDGLTSLEGIQYLSGLEDLSCYYQKGLTELPASVGTLQQLERISLTKCGITELPDSICNCINLVTLQVNDTAIFALPNDIGNLSNLTELNISDTKITEFPESLYALNLQHFYRDGLDID